MTRTARASFPRAIIKDRSESKSGHRDDKHVRKDGGGPHGWGRLTDEKDLEEAALRDEAEEFNSISEDTVYPRRRSASTASINSSSSAETDLMKARKFRKGALKVPGLDLAAIARTSVAASMSPISPTSAGGMGGMVRSASR